MNNMSNEFSRLQLLNGRLNFDEESKEMFFNKESSIIEVRRDGDES